ncbi:hypothetical protein [Candidatus Nitrosocosmicus arcticus]|uniref:Uncharacterized protein n=1 Tax=Candidatus Nitrosocosmicus arcticus TaxID=2035267 RepID=A0A557SYC3_9ARCH|nr:hypothetical protein [Candidatus Nitrosocosmicus arcticus]TVP41593.1 exported protein of unknown function [Candidatus Nitrosocosmicus arcticus]
MLSEKRNMSIMVTIAVVSLILAVIPTIVTSDINLAFAHSCHDEEHDHDDDGDNDGNGNSNEAEQGISQEQSSVQNSQVVSGGDSIASGNNVGLFFNDNIGNLALGQQ